MFDSKNGTAVKICGITRREDAFKAVELGVDALGFNTWKGTKRYLDIEAAGSWISEIPQSVVRVAVTVNSTPEEMEKIAQLPFIDVIQLHGDEGEKEVSHAIKFGKPIIKAVRPKSISDLEAVNKWPLKDILLDAFVDSFYGGTGASQSEEMITEFLRLFPDHSLWLAGGLTPENVGNKVLAINPTVVDVASGVESEPGKKDAEKMKAFINAVKI
jgi:phosphoribosylanthranilate isomerase